MLLRHVIFTHDTGLHSVGRIAVADIPFIFHHRNPGVPPIGRVAWSVTNLSRRDSAYMFQ